MVSVAFSVYCVICRVFGGYDVVQIISPYFLRLRSERTLPVYRYLQRHNGKVFWELSGPTIIIFVLVWKQALFTIRILRSETGIVIRLLIRLLSEIGIMGAARATRVIAETCNGIIACLWEYYASYQPYFSDKTAFIPLPIDLREVISRVRGVPEKLNFFIGIQSARSNLKGTDVMLPVLQEVQRKYSELCRITEVHDVPYARYQQLMDDADVQLDQLYSYTPSMNSLLAMAKGVTVVGGGEPENYEILNETELRPIINVLPDEQDIYQKLEDIVLHKERIPELSAQSIEYVAKYHDHVKVARQYLDFWEKH